MQTKKWSVVETITSTLVGFIISVGVTNILLPFMGYPVTIQDNLTIVSVFTIVSFIKGYGVRRLFVWLQKMKK